MIHDKRQEDNCATPVKREESYESGQLIFREGDPYDGVLYILNKGKLEILRSNELIAEISGENVFFGEMSLLLGSPRTASVKTLTPCTITTYEGGLEQIVRQLPMVTLKLLASLAWRLEQTSRDYVEILENLHNVEELMAGKEAVIEEVNERNQSLEQQNEELQSSIEALQRVLDNKQKELDELTQKRGLFGRQRKRK